MKRKKTLADTLTLPKKQAKRVVKGAEKVHAQKTSKIRNVSPKPVDSAPTTRPYRELPHKTVKAQWQRNDMVAIRDGEEDVRGIVLGYSGEVGKIVVQLLDGKTRRVVPESQVIGATEARDNAE